MFCLDYALSCFVHFHLSKALQDRFPAVDRRHFGVAAGVGASSGLASAIALYPFDFVRQATVSGASRFAFSSVPFSACFFGIYFSQSRRGDPLPRQAGLALAAAGLASAAELPFDRSKHGMAGPRSAALLAVLRLPLASCILMAYGFLANERLDWGAVDQGRPRQQPALGA